MKIGEWGWIGNLVLWTAIVVGALAWGVGQHQERERAEGVEKVQPDPGLSRGAPQQRRGAEARAPIARTSSTREAEARVIEATASRPELRRHPSRPSG